jgi:hypothetical protein
MNAPAEIALQMDTMIHKGGEGSDPHACHSDLLSIPPAVGSMRIPLSENLRCRASIEALGARDSSTRFCRYLLNRKTPEYDLDLGAPEFTRSSIFELGLKLTSTKIDYQ